MIQMFFQNLSRVHVRAGTQENFSKFICIICICICIFFIYTCAICFIMSAKIQHFGRFCKLFPVFFMISGKMMR